MVIILLNHRNYTDNLRAYNFTVRLHDVAHKTATTKNAQKIPAYDCMFDIILI